MWKKFKSFFKFRESSSIIYQKFESKGFEIIIRQAENEDIKEMLDVQRDVYLGEAPWIRSSFQYEFRNPAPHLYLVAIVQDKVVGYIGVRIDNVDAHITNLAIHSSYQGCRIATAFIEEIKIFAKKNNAKKISLEVRFENKVAQMVYRKNGFMSEQVLRGYYVEEKEDGIRMVCTL